MEEAALECHSWKLPLDCIDQSNLKVSSSSDNARLGMEVVYLLSKNEEHLVKLPESSLEGGNRPVETAGHARRHDWYTLGGTVMVQP